jgi:hypothetical protein
MLRTMHLACRILLPAGFLLIALAAVGVGGAKAQQGTPEAREACTPDAMRLCSDFIPDVAKVTRCMMAKRAQLSAPCRLAMSHARPGGYRSVRTGYRTYRYSRYSRGRCEHFRCR